MYVPFFYFLYTKGCILYYNFLKKLFKKISSIEGYLKFIKIQQHCVYDLSFDKYSCIATSAAKIVCISQNSFLLLFCSQFSAPPFWSLINHLSACQRGICLSQNLRHSSVCVHVAYFTW